MANSWQFLFRTRDPFRSSRPLVAAALQPPIRSELFSLERLEQHAESLAAAQPVAPHRRAGKRLAKRLDDNNRVLTAAYRAVSETIESGQSITPAAEWLLDNFYVVDEQIREIKNDLPPGYYRKLPKLAEGPLEGLPRVFGLAWALVAHTDSAFDLQKLTRFVVAYQRVQPLMIGELWAIAITLRITLVENLRRLSEAIIARLVAGRDADILADRILGSDSQAPEPEAVVLDLLNRTPWSNAFAVQLAMRLRDRDPNTTPALRWLNQKLAAQGSTTDQIVREDVQHQSALNVTIRNVVTSMRLITTINWPEFFESVGLVDATLRAGSDFAAMDFQTRDLYRRAIEELASESGKSEIAVAQAAVAAARRARGANKSGLPARDGDPGYYLIARGRRAFEKTLAVRVSLKEKFIRANSDVGVISYVILIGVITAVILAGALYAVDSIFPRVGDGLLVWLGFLGIVPASDVAVAIANRLITHQVGAVLLPALELQLGVPDEMRTIVVMPTLLTSIASIEEHVERLEVHYLGNPDDNLAFALLSDWMDSASEQAPNDEILLDAAAKGIARLNARHPKLHGEKRFFLLHRHRLWNEGEGKWIGWERKRGKLHELNRLMRGAPDTGFVAIDNEPPSLPAGLHYVVTLDADTRMPIGTVKRLIGKMAHPLNRPKYDPVSRCVVAGHAILQPRVTPSLPMGLEGSLYQRVFSGPNGLDPYALAISDVYQDLFEEGSYVGKGIYDVDVFEAVLQARIPENAVLSHDLLEGIFARAGLATDIEFVEEFPSRYDVASARQHRWVRGDWQLLPWIFGVGVNSPADGNRNPVSLMGRWKLLDNLRRSLSAPAALLAFIAGWLTPLPVGLVWTLFILATIAVPPLLPAFFGLIPRRVGISVRSHIGNVRADLVLGFMQIAFLVTFLAHQAWLMVDAILRTLYRLFIRRRRLLEWVTAAQIKQNTGADPRSLIAQVVASASFAIFIAVIMFYVDHHAWYLSTPFAALWVLSPLVAHWASAPPPLEGRLTIAAGRARALRLIARRTWRFFEKFVTDEDHDLPPDNFQEDPKPVVAHRTSPTNIGLYLLSAVAAHDFGWIGSFDLLDRIEATFATMQKMERFRGHFYNWYDTTDLRALLPKYISSVDSGNLAGHLLALANACRDVCTGPVVGKRWRLALRDTLDLVKESEAARRKMRGASVNEALDAAIEDFSRLLKDDDETPAGLKRQLSQMTEKSAAVADAAKFEAAGPFGADVAIWADALQACVGMHSRDFDFLMPWAQLIPEGTPVGGHDELSMLLATLPALRDVRRHCESALDLLESRGGQAELIDALEISAHRADVMIGRLSAVADDAKTMFSEMEFGFLFNPDRQLLSIGYREVDGTLDSNFYDLLASEARLTSFIAIAKGDVPAKHWFRMGRTLTPLSGGSALISWSGSMFEYLMPSLVMRAPSGSLLEQTNRLIVRRQEDYGNELGVPWGMSESQYNARDLEQTYQYSSFGVPDLGYKRGLSENTVIAPYASGLAAMIDPAAAAKNFKRMADIGACGDYGWYEALDYTPSRLPEGAKVAIVHAFMSHHQGMALVGIANALHSGAMRERFHAEPIIQATELLLQERMPRDVAVARKPPQQALEAKAAGQDPRGQRRYNSAHSRVPRTHILSNGSYSAMVTAAGSGYSRWRDVAITRWREDVTCDNWGAYFFIRDLRSGDVWTAGYQPSGIEPDSYDVTFTEDRAEIVRNDGAVTTTLEIAVSPEDDAEVRRVSITNHGTRAREIEVTSYAEIALARQADDLAHPAFAKLFVETEFVPNLGAILATRRQRSPADPKVWAAHLCVVEGDTLGNVQFETDRARFLGRGQTVRSPAAISDGWPLSNTAGPVLDPVFSLRRRVRVPRGATVRLAFWTVAASTREEILDLADKHHDAMAYDRATTLAWTQAQMQLHHLGIRFDEANLFQRLANHVLYTDPTLRPPSDALKSGLAKSSTLWANGISGDLPIILVRIEDESDIELVRQLLRAHEYWRLKQLAVDLVILNERASSYVQDLQIALDGLVRMNRAMPNMAGEQSRGNAYVLRADMVSPEVRALLLASARAVLLGGHGTLAEQVNRARDLKPGVAPPARKPLIVSPPESPLPQPQMEFFNGLGGFARDGREYVTILEGNQRTPAPWINVIANPNFGFHVSADGSGFTWSVNSQQYQLTPWSNDPVGDAPGEVVYIRDDETGEVWNPTALPIREKASPYTVRHGQGYTVFEHAAHGIALEMTQFVPLDDSIKIARLKIANHSGRERKLTITHYVEWVLGQSRGAMAPYIVTEIDPQTGALFAGNDWNNAFGGRVAFADMAAKQTAWTGDRTEFVGRDGTLDRPLALTPGTVLSNRVGAGMDPCAVLQAQVRLNAVGTTEIVFFLGDAATREQAQALIAKYRAADLDAVFKTVTGQWDNVLGTVQVKTPDRALDLLLNRWLVYQVLACRVWARTAFYQASGAYGFRDQLQDVMALCLARPDIARAHILRSAGRQFEEGDVQHWWLPETGNGIRTRVSDDRGWLAFVVAHYVETTGDVSVLDEMVPFLEGPVLKDGQHDAFFQPTTSDKKISVFDHCALALDKSMGTGVHGLPLMGTGDWNDGMDQVGAGGKGESIWLAWFLHSCLTSFAAIADKHGAAERGDSWRGFAAALREAVDMHAWDGDWYRRAYFDDGTPLGSIADSQCRIDSIAQSWSIISGGAEPARAMRAMEAVEKFLIRRDEKLALLFTPPFDHPQNDPGYIKGYPPGVRENGGQYTHGATWAALAFAMLGDGDRAGELLSLLNPINHSSNRTDMDRYKVEPYVICADLYSVPPHAGRGGWTWYTGSAGWTYRIALEWLLGLRLQGDKLLLDPCIPRSWPGFEMTYRHGTAQYDIFVENPLRVCRGIIAVKLDGQNVTGDNKALIPLVDDGAKHRVQVVLG